jgi:hypothetical protein
VDPERFAGGFPLPGGRARAVSLLETGRAAHTVLA